MLEIIYSLISGRLLFCFNISTAINTAPAWWRVMIVHPKAVSTGVTTLPMFEL